MVLIRLFVLLLLFIPISSSITINHPLQDGNADSESEGGSIEKVLGQPVSAETAIQMNFQGRKFMNNKVMKLGDVGAKIKSLGTSKISNIGKVFMYVEKRKNGRKLVSVNDEVSGFVAFNADYRGPRHHPPKNN